MPCGSVDVGGVGACGADGVCPDVGVPAVGVVPLPDGTDGVVAVAGVGLGVPDGMVGGKGKTGVGAVRGGCVVGLPRDVGRGAALGAAVTGAEDGCGVMGGKFGDRVVG